MSVFGVRFQWDAIRRYGSPSLLLILLLFALSVFASPLLSLVVLVLLVVINICMQPVSRGRMVWRLLVSLSPLLLLLVFMSSLSHLPRSGAIQRLAPFLMLGALQLLVFCTVLSFCLDLYSRRQRSEAMRAFAAEHGWQFHARAHRDLLRITDGFRAVYTNDMRPRIENVISRKHRSVTVALFDFCFYRPRDVEFMVEAAIAAATEGRSGVSGGNIRRRSVACVWSDTLRLPYFALRREGPLDRLLARPGPQDADFGDQPSFSKLYRLEGEDADALRELFSRDLLEFFVSRASQEHDIMVEGQDNCLMLHCITENLPPAELTRLIEETEAVFGAFLRSQRSHSGTLAK